MQKSYKNAAALKRMNPQKKTNPKETFFVLSNVELQ